LLGSVAHADFVILDDLIVDGSACVGFDCADGEAFSFDTIRLRENNLRIKFDDTSTGASFSRNDWQLTANDSSNGGQSKFSIDDVTGGRTPFTVEANAPTNSLYLEDTGDLGLGTNNPVVDIHTVEGDTPTLRLEQDGSSGFAPQTWDVAGNETNFFIRDVTNGSTLPFRIRPSAPTSSLTIDAEGNIGMGTSSPTADMDISRSGGRVQMRLVDSDSRDAWQIIMDEDGNGNEGLSFTREGTASREFRISPTGALFVNGAAHTVPDFVFDSNYDLMPLAEIESFILKNKHLPNVPSAADIKKNGLGLTGMQMTLLEKVEELTLHTISQEKMIDSQSQMINSQSQMIGSQNQMIAELAERMVALEAAELTD
jgi:hypothetical protein